MGENSGIRVGTIRRPMGGMGRLPGWDKGEGMQGNGLRSAISVGKRSNWVIEDKTDLGFLLGMEATGRTGFTLQEDVISIIHATHATSLVIHAFISMLLLAIIPGLNVEDHAPDRKCTPDLFLFQFRHLPFHKAFEVCGILSDVYVARNRNARGQNYGFVRYINVKDVAKLQKALNNVYFGQNKVWTNVACFDRFGEVKKVPLNGLEDGKKSAAVGGKNKSKNNADDEKKESNIMGGKNKLKNSEKIVVKEKINEGEKNNDGGIIESEKEEMVLVRKHALEQVKLNAKGSEEEREQVRLSGVAGDIPYANFFKEKHTSHVSDAPKVIGEANVTRKFHSDNEDVVWASKEALAKLLNGQFIPIVQQKIIDAGFDNVRVVPRGGDNVILFFPGKEDMMSVYLAAADFFNCFFTDMRA
ncbi:RNA recognition motif [Medicago truncatula]|uniref:RNA recognition motif n=1 Tax=Medicago truncatula TaxID=3880 RepID=A0A072U9C8_MEDTR|nr:RNA recognition motif [Medicago truncatula]